MSTARRQFIGAAALLDSAAPLAGRAAQRTKSANDRIQLGVIGLGGRGTADVHVALDDVGGAALVAVSDLYVGRRTRAREVFGKDLFVTSDYRELLARADIDAVIVATPDHWHAQASIDALNAGKDVYCEKPMVHSIEEGHAVIAAQRTSGRIIQVGSQRVSSIIYQKARELVRDGAIGKLNLVEAWWERPVDTDELVFRNSIPPDASPSTIDWDRFVANTTRRPFNAQQFFRWHNYRDYGTGIPGDLFVHLFAGVHFVLDSEGPERMMATGGTRYWNDGREIPDLMLGLADYAEGARHPAFNMSLRVNFEQGSDETSGFRFVGEKGILHIQDDGVRLARHNRPPEPGYHIETFAAAAQREFLQGYRQKYPVLPATPESMRLTPVEDFWRLKTIAITPRTWPSFLAAVRSRKPVVEDAVFGLRAAGPALLANACHYERKSVVGIHERWSAYETGTDDAARAADGGRRGASRAGERGVRPSHAWERGREQAARSALRCAHSAAQGEPAREGHAGAPPGLRRHRTGSGVAGPACGGDSGAACRHRRRGQRHCGIDSAFGYGSTEARRRCGVGPAPVADGQRAWRRLCDRGSGLRGQQVSGYFASDECAGD
jgi:predicted dehydrogenase